MLEISGFQGFEAGKYWKLMDFKVMKPRTLEVSGCLGSQSTHAHTSAASLGNYVHEKQAMLEIPDVLG